MPVIQHIHFDPEAISIALFNLLTATPGINTFSRKGAEWSNVSPGDQPYLALIEYGASAVQDTTLGLTKWKLRYRVLVYIRADAEPGGIPATAINNILQSIFDALSSTPPGNKQTLGGMVNNAWIDGEIFIDTGILDQQCALLVPVSVELGN